MAPLKPANCGFVVEWSARIPRDFAGAPLKNVALSCDGARVRGEAVVTRSGLEGGAVYALSAALREAIAADGFATLAIDFKPDVAEATLAARLASRPGQSLSTLLRKSAGLAPVAVALLREAGPLPEERRRPRSPDQGLRASPRRPGADRARDLDRRRGHWSEIDANFMLVRRPGIFVAGEMIDWEAPTGGYLLQACLATGAVAGRAAARWMG